MDIGNDIHTIKIKLKQLKLNIAGVYYSFCL